MARSTKWMCMKSGLRTADRAKRVENSGCLPARQETPEARAPARRRFQHGPQLRCTVCLRLAYASVMRYVLGFDGGGTKTECVLMSEDGRIVAQSRGGPSNPNRVGFGGALA